MNFARSMGALVAVLIGAVSTAAQTVRPTGDAVPVNLLRFSIQFEQPPEGPVLPRLELTDADGRKIQGAFLEQELWSPDNRILTVLMHPGRVKSGLIANEELGRALVDGDKVTLTFNGRPIKRWRIVGEDRTGPDPSRWTATTPRLDTRDQLTVQLDGSVDAFGTGLIAVRAPSGVRLEGRAMLDRGESIWRFTPDHPWTVGRYVVVAAPDLEDASGNRPGLPFEHQNAMNAEFAEGPRFDVGIDSRGAPTQKRTTERIESP